VRVFVTILEESPAAAIQAIASIDLDHDGVEIRAERFSAYDPATLRQATAKPIILTHRGTRADPALLRQALDGGIEFVDIELGSEIPVPPERVVLSHHDFEGMPDVKSVALKMRAARCAATKIAVTPQNFADNQELLRQIAPGVTVIGMGERGLYSRILAPFLGSDLVFVAPDRRGLAAPGQITLDEAAVIYGNRTTNATRIFAILGNPAGHSLSPAIHNPLFRAKGVPGAYTIASFESFAEVEGAFLAGEISGLSVTAPFKEDAFHFAVRHDAIIGENAREAGAVNTLVNCGTVSADNTDVDGFTAILARLCGRERKSVAIVGAGGTARAARVAVNRAGMHVMSYNRSPGKGSEPLSALAAFDGEIIINTAPADAEIELPLRAGMTYIEAAYGGTLRPRVDGVEWIGGLELLHAQAVRQHELFMKVWK